MWDLETIKRLNAKTTSKPEPVEDIPYLPGEDSLSENIIAVLLAHARYSFSEVGWDFDSLTMKEKTLVKNQKTLDAIKRASTMGLELGSNL